MVIQIRIELTLEVGEQYEMDKWKRDEIIAEEWMKLRKELQPQFWSLIKNQGRKSTCGKTTTRCGRTRTMMGSKKRRSSTILSNTAKSQTKNNRAHSRQSRVARGPNTARYSTNTSINPYTTPITENKGRRKGMTGSRKAC